MDPAAAGFQNADYDPGSGRVFFYPWGGLVSRPSATLLAYHVDRNFSSADSYDVVNLTTTLGPDAQGFATGLLDTVHNSMYLVPFRKDIGSGIQPNDLAVRYDLSKDLHDRHSYETFHLSSMPNPPPQLGWITGVFISGHVYYMPFGTPRQGEPLSHLHGYLLRYDSSRGFTDAGSWSWFDLRSNIDPNAFGFQSAGVKVPWLYIVPYMENVLVRFNVNGSFTEHTSYEKVDLTMLNPKAVGYTGTVIAGDFLVLVPWRNLRATGEEQGVSVVAKFDTRRELTDKGAWEFLDLRDVHPDAAGYQFGWTDRRGFVHLSPSTDFAHLTAPPFVVWDSSQPFTLPASWNSYPSTGMPISAGCAYDGTHGYIAPYGFNGRSGKVTRVTTTPL